MIYIIIITILIYSLVLTYQVKSLLYMRKQGLTYKEIIMDIMMCVKCQSFLLSFIILIFHQSFIITLLISSTISLIYLTIEKHYDNY